jgi:hypothetical protein
MDRRMALGAMGLAVSPLLAKAQPGREGHAPGDEWEHCLSACALCVTACGGCREHCTRHASGGGHADLATVCGDCGERCATMLTLTSRRSMLAPSLAKGCAGCCERCASECDRIDGDIVKACAQACRDCAAACRAM